MQINYYETVEPILFIRRELPCQTLINDIKDIVLEVQIQNNLFIDTLPVYLEELPDQIQNIISNSINFN